MRFLLAIILLGLLKEVSSWCLRTTLAEGMQIIEADWASDNSIFVTANKGEKTIRIYNANSFELLKIYNHTGIQPMSIKISKDSKYIAVGYINSDLLIFYAVSPFNIYFQKATGQNSIAQVDFTYDNIKVISCGNNQRYVSYNLATGSGPIDNYKYLPNPGAAIACRSGPFGHTAYSDNNRRVRVVDSTNTEIYNQVYADDVQQIDFLPNSGTFGFVSKDKNMRINVTSTTANSIYLDSDDLLTVSFGKQGKYYAFGGKTLTLFIYNQTTNIIVAKFNNFKSIINSVKFSKDENYLIAADAGGDVRIYAIKCFSSCQSGEYNFSGVCLKCSSAISNCVNCQSSAACNQCMAGYYSAGSSCTACYKSLSYCLQCKDSNTCLKCLDGYYIDTVSGTCKRCPMQGCMECNDSLICTKCFKNDFYLDTVTNSCKKCADTLSQCIRCYNSSVCVDCQIGFYEDPTTKACLQCPANCLICQSSTNCTECKVGYWASGGSCIRCTDTSCLSCNQTGVCYDCKEGKYLTASNTCSSCTNPCTTCSVSATNCTGCQLGYYLDAASFQCVKCIQNCKMCNESTKCLSCFPGFKVDATTLTCKPCLLYYNNCSQCNSSQCLKCREGFYADTTASYLCKICITVIPNCMQCANSSTCLQCITSYYPTGSIGISSCAACPVGCQQCVSGTNCTKCFSTYFLNTSLLCTPCQNNCFQCTSALVCQSCVVGYYFDTGTKICKTCQSVLTYCFSCVDINTCIFCQPGAYLDTTTNKCKLCTSNCLTCNMTDCSSCQVGYYLDATSPLTCKMCGQFCQQCTSSAQCTSCIDGYYLDSSDNKCKSCSLMFGYCTLCNKTNCFQCAQGTALNTTTGNTCPPCNNHIKNCKTCYWDNLLATPAVKCSTCNYGFGLATTNLLCSQCKAIQGCIQCKSASLCTKCEIGYFLKNDNTCGICASSCFTCDNALTCLSCNQGYVIDTGNCVLCETKITGCTKCIVGTATTYNCTYCQVGFYMQLTDSQCHICHQVINGCYTCNNSATCTSCLDKYFLDSFTQSCKKCVTGIAGCQLCNSSSVCLSCEDTYYLDLTNDKCYFCSDNIPGCLHCQDNTHCSQCNSGYYLLSDNTCGFCEAALEGCIYCNSQTFCLQCRAGFYLDTTDNKCHQCTQPGCDVCEESNPNNCVSCSNNFYLVGATCADCTNLASYCYECNSTECIECEVGYYLASPLSCMRCSSTMSGCSRCSDGSTCLECMSSYFVNSSNQCQQCNKVLFGCQNCINASVCISCSANFFLNSSTSACQSCTDISGCMLCKNQSTCVLCQQKYYMESSQCLLCNQAIKGCFSCISSAVCVQCQSGYVLDGESYKCVINTIEVKEKVQGLKLISFYISAGMLKHILYVKGNNFHKVDSLNITLGSKTTLLVQDYTGKQIQLTILSYEYGNNGYSIIFYTDNPLGNAITLNTRQMSFRRLLADEELNLQVLMKMNPQVYQQILPQLDYTGSMTVKYSLNDPEFVNSYIKAEAGNQYFFYEVIGIIFVVLFLVNYLIKFLCTLPHSRNRTTLLPHVIALKACCLIIYPTHFEYISFCKGFMIVDFYWLNSLIAETLTDLSDKVVVPFGLFFQNTSIAGTFLLGLSVYIALALFVQAYSYMMKDERQSQKSSEQSEISSSEERQRQKEFKIQKLQEAIGVNYDNDDSQSNKLLLLKKNCHELLWNIFTFSVVYYSCLNVQGAFYNYQQIITVNGVFYILGMLLFICVTVETFYSFVRNHRQLNKVRVYLKGCLLSIAYINPIYVVSVCVTFDIMLSILEFNEINPKTKFSKFFILTHILSTVCIALMIIVSQSLVSLIITAMCLLVCLGVEIFIHIKQYQIAHQDLQSKEFNADQNEVKQQNQEEQNDFIANIWDLSKKTNKNHKQVHELDMHATMEVFDKSNNFQIEGVDIQRSLKKNLSPPKEMLKTVVKQRGRRTKLRQTQDAFRSNVIEVVPHPFNDRNNARADRNKSVFEEERKSP